MSLLMFGVLALGCRRDEAPPPQDGSGNIDLARRHLPSRGFARSTPRRGDEFVKAYTWPHALGGKQYELSQAATARFRHRLSIGARLGHGLTQRLPRRRP